MRSDQIKKGLERVPHRALLHATGLSRNDLKRPFIGVATSFTDLIPGHVGMRDLERFIERGFVTAAGVRVFIRRAWHLRRIAMGHLGMCYPLALRELVADMIETVCNAHQLDGIICLTNCDKITPGMLMGVARLNIPAIIITAGPMVSGRYNKRKLAFVHDTYEGMGRAKIGDISEEELTCLEMEACPGQGSCQGLYTANTMACLTETMGMSIPGCGTALAGSAKKRRIAQASGERIVELVRKNVLPRDIITQKSLENAIVVDMALGGSSNTVLHLMAIAHEAGIKLDLKTFDKISKSVPHITNIEPAGEHFMEDVEYAGGIPAVLKRLKSKLNNTLNVSGEKTFEIADKAKIFDETVIRTFDEAYHKQADSCSAHLALDESSETVRVTIKMMEVYRQARVFNREEEAMQAIWAARLEKAIAWLSFMKPAGGRGNGEMLAPTLPCC